MIKSFKHRGLQALYEGKTPRKVASEHVEKLRRILGVLDRSRSPNDTDLPGFKLHPLKGNRKGEFAVWVDKNWRVTFGFEDGDAMNVDYTDYH